MKVFLSWAGNDSRYIAECLKAWLPQVLQALDPWMSTHIEKGDAWDGAIAEGLSDSPVGILCLTKDSIILTTYIMKQELLQMFRIQKCVLFFTN